MQQKTILLFAALAMLAAQTARAATITVTTTADSGPGSLRAALAGAADGDTIDATGVSGAIRLTSGQLRVTKSVSILGPGPNHLAVNGNFPNTTNRVFYIGSNTVVTISSLTITNGHGDYPWVFTYGSGIYNDHATLAVSNCTLSGNSGGVGGGGIYNDGSRGGISTLTIANSTLSRNSAHGSGGGIYNYADLGGTATVHIVNSTLSSNSAGLGAAGLGGGIYNRSDTSGIEGDSRTSLTIVSSTLTDNSAGLLGGGIYDECGEGGSAKMEIVNSTLSSNSASQGGGIYKSSGDSSTSLTIVNSTLTGNSAFSDGGGIFDVSGGSASLEIVNSTLSSNSAVADYGGGILKASYGGGSAKMEIVNSTLSGNSASNGFGGAIFTQAELLESRLNLTVVNSTLSGNSADRGGGIYNSNVGGTASVQIVNSTLSGNSANLGGGIFNFVEFGRSASLEIGSTILNAGASGGNITNDFGTVTSLGYNLSSDDGGGFLTATGDQIDTDPLLGPLQDNGGPTFTHALLCGSPAIDKGINFTTATTDQRGVGFIRIFDDPSVLNATGGVGADIGAFEVQPGVCAPRDGDGDGVVDALDPCPGTPPGAIVNSTGCSMAQLVPCAGPRSGGRWKNHGQYVQTVLHTATEFLKAKLITRRQWAQIVTHAAHSKCGWNRRWDHDGDRDWRRDWDWYRDGNWGRGRDGDSERDRGRD